MKQSRSLQCLMPWVLEALKTFLFCPVPRGSDTAEMEAAWFDELCLSNFISFFLPLADEH